MNRALEFPKLRWPLDIRLEKLPDQEVLVLSCPSGIAPGPLALVPAVGPLLGCFEGHLSIDQITAKFSPLGVRRELVEELVRLLDEHLFLSSPRFFAADRAARDEFKSSSRRLPALAGTGYSPDADSLRQQVDHYLEQADKSAQCSIEQGVIGAIISPHIDYRRGSECYGLTYRHLRGQRHQLYILLGTAHQYSKRLFHLTSKDFETPLGLMRHEKDFVSRLAGKHGLDRSFEDEFLHRREHSLELQLPFLARLQPQASIVPILVGSFHHLLGVSKLPNDDEEYESFASALAEGVVEKRKAGVSVCFIAGVDLAHIGKAFGDSGALSPEIMASIAGRDRILLDAISTHDKRKFFGHIAEDADARRVCGFPALYTLLDVLERSGMRYQAMIYDYRQAVDYRADCAVSFVGAGLRLS